MKGDPGLSRFGLDRNGEGNFRGRVVWCPRSRIRSSTKVRHQESLSTRGEGWVRGDGGGWGVWGLGPRTGEARVRCRRRGTTGVTVLVKGLK